MWSRALEDALADVASSYAGREFFDPLKLLGTSVNESSRVGEHNPIIVGAVGAAVEAHSCHCVVMPGLIVS